MIGWVLYFALLCRKTWYIAEILAYLTNIEIFQEISEYQNCFRNIDIVIDISKSI
jgi:hypothetical protein